MSFILDNSTRSILQVLLDYDNVLERSVTPFVKYIDKMLTMKCVRMQVGRVIKRTQLTAFLDPSPDIEFTENHG